MLSPAGTLSISPLECFVEASGTRLASALPIRKAFRAHGQGQTPPCPPVRCRRRPFAASDCRSENRIWLADMFAHKARRNRNFQRTEKGTKMAALMRPFSCPTGACSSRKCSPSQARQNPAVSLPGVAAIRLHHSSLKSAEHGRQSIAPASGLEQAGQKLVPSGKAFCCRMPCDAFSGNSPPNILYLSTATSTLQGLMTAVTSEPSSRRRRLTPSRVIIAVICAPPGSSSTTSPLTKPRVSFLILPVN